MGSGRRFASERRKTAALMVCSASRSIAIVQRMPSIKTLLLCFALFYLCVDLCRGQLLGEPVARLSVARSNLAAASLDDTILFAGGVTKCACICIIIARPAHLTSFPRSAGNPVAVVDCFDVLTLRHWTLQLSVARSHLAGASASGVVYFGGGRCVAHRTPLAISTMASQLFFIPLKL